MSAVFGRPPPLSIRVLYCPACVERSARGGLSYKRRMKNLGLVHHVTTYPDSLHAFRAERTRGASINRRTVNNAAAHRTKAGQRKRVGRPGVSKQPGPRSASNNTILHLRVQYREAPSECASTTTMEIGLGRYTDGASPCRTSFEHVEASSFYLFLVPT